MSHLPPSVVATADQRHARGRHLFRALVSDYRTHRDTCTEPMCVTTNREEITVARLAVELYDGLTRCGHVDCTERNVRMLCEALAYAGVRAVEGRCLDA